LNYIDLFDRAARISADRLALTDEAVSLTYRDLSRLANRLAGALIAKGFDPSAPFAMLSPNTSLAMAALIGSLKAGGAWSNINLRSALATNIDILRRGRCEALFFHSSIAGEVAQILEGVPTLRIVVCLDEDLGPHASLARFAEGAGEANVNVRLEPGATAFQGSTGGTTGAPKVTQNGPGLLLWDAIGFMTALSFEAPPVNLAIAPITHGAGIVALATLAMGGTVVLAPSVDLGQVLATIETHKVSLLFLPPTLIYMLMNHPRARQTDFSSLRYLMSAAAPFAVEKIAAAHALFGPVVCQSFGQTESGFPLTFMAPDLVTEALANPAHAGRLRSVGLPTANVSAIEIMNDAGEILPAGEVGEIVVRAPMVMERYVDDPQATAAIKRDGWQRTGDVGCRDADGFVYVSDRKRDLIISGGFNVFPLEVEQVLVRHPAVQDCAVIGVPDEKWGEAVKAVVELAPGASASEAELIELCKAALGGVMAPKSVDFIAELPRSAVGKVLKRELRELYWSDQAGRI
jgi:acyl-CoA synthetase (AMP-forming)/AMP-acid ligase II